MQIYTSNYAKIKQLKENNIVPISISAITPKYLKGQVNYYLSYLAPRYKMLKMSEEKYIPEYKKLLSNLNPEQVIRDIKNYSKNQDCALLCYEVPSDFCHRHMVSEWLNKNTNYNIKEWELKKKKIDTTQMLLF